MTFFLARSRALRSAFGASLHSGPLDPPADVLAIRREGPAVRSRDDYCPAVLWSGQGRRTGRTVSSAPAFYLRIFGRSDS